MDGNAIGRKITPITSGRYPIYTADEIRLELFASKCERKALKSLTAKEVKAQRKEEGKKREEEKKCDTSFYKKK